MIPDVLTELEPAGLTIQRPQLFRNLAQLNTLPSGIRQRSQRYPVDPARRMLFAHGFMSERPEEPTERAQAIPVKVDHGPHTVRRFLPLPSVRGIGSRSGSPPFPAFDFDDWSARDDSPRTKVTTEMLDTIFQGGRRRPARWPNGA